MIRIDEIWLATEPLDMRAGPDTALARVVKVFGFCPTALCLPVRQSPRQPDKGINSRWPGDLALCASPGSGQVPLGRYWHGDRAELSPEQVTALVQGLPWQRIGPAGAISVL